MDGEKGYYAKRSKTRLVGKTEQIGSDIWFIDRETKGQGGKIVELSNEEKSGEVTKCKIGKWRMKKQKREALKKSYLLK